MLRGVVWAGCLAALAATLLCRLDAGVSFPRAMERRDYEAARAIADRLAFLGHDRVEERISLGEAFVREGRLGRALEQYWRSAALHPEPVAYLRIGQLRARIGDWRGALRAYEAGLGVKPDAAPLLRGAAQAASRLGRTEQARAFLERARSLAPGNAPALEPASARDGGHPVGEEPAG